MDGKLRWRILESSLDIRLRPF